MLKKTVKKAAAFFISVVILFSTAAALAERTGKVHGGWLILRDAPSYNGRQISSYPSGTVVTVTGQNGAWYAVTTPDSLTGYMLGKFLTVTGDALIAGSDAWVTSSNGLNVRLRAGNGTQYKAIASYAPGTKCKVLETGSRFCKIQIGTSTGYMMTKFLTSAKPEAPESDKILYEVYVTSSNGRGVNMRSAPYVGNNVVGFFDVGTKAGMIKPGDAWSLIDVGGRQGYMMSQFLSKEKPAPSGTSGGSFIISFNGKNVNLRSGAGMKYPIINSYAPGTPITILSSGPTWDFVKVGGIYGYMMDQFIVTKGK